jgi:hypothetical protein
MMNARSIPVILSLTYGLVACTSNNSSRQSYIEDLARPPKLQSERSKTATVTGDREINTSGARSEEPLGENVSMVESNPPSLRIKQPVNEAWQTVGLALQKLKAEKTVRNRKEGVYFVKYDADDLGDEDKGFFQTTIGDYFSNSYEVGLYKIVIKAQQSETEVFIEEAPDSVDRIRNYDGYDPGKPASPEVVLKNLYMILHDTVLTESKDKKNSEGTDG